MTMYPTPRRGGENNAREMLLSLGMGNYNATIAVQYMFLAPAATDPAMPSIFLMTKHLQQGLRAAGARDVAVTGVLDNPTADALARLVGPDWNHVTWYALFGATTAARRTRALEDHSSDIDLGGLPSLPDVPGGTFTWIAAGVAAWYFLIRKKGR